MVRALSAVSANALSLDSLLHLMLFIHSIPIKSKKINHSIYQSDYFYFISKKQLLVFRFNLSLKIEMEVVFNLPNLLIAGNVGHG